MLFFDITRLISSLKSSYATGIDRVEMNYVLYILEHNIDVEFVFKFRGRFFIAKKEIFIKFIDFLNSKWKKDNFDKSFLKYKTIHNFRKKIAKTSFLNKTLLCQKAKILINKENVLDTYFINAINSTINPVYLNISHANIENINFMKALKNRQVKIACMLHDLIPLTHPQYCTEASHQKHKIRIENMVKYADYIISNSKSTEIQLKKYSDKMHLSICAKLIVAPLGTEVLVKKNFYNKELPDHYFLTVGTIEPRKNHALLLQIWEELLDELGEQCPYLYIVGKRGWKNDDVFEKLNMLKQKTNKIFEINDASDEKLTDLIIHADALLMPTFVEGWCMPITEALSLNTIVICNDLDVLRESGQNIPYYIANNNYIEWKKAILKIDKLLNNRNTNKYQIIKWDNHISAVLNSI